MPKWGFSRYLCRYVFFVVFAFSLKGFAFGCSDIVAASELPQVAQEINKLGQTDPELADRAKTLALYENLAATDASLVELLPRESVYPILADLDMDSYPALLAEALEKVRSSERQANYATKLEFVLRKILKGEVPESTIESRIEALHHPKAGTVLRALGDMTIKEVYELYHGGSPLSPTADSIIGRYLEETGATTLVRTFNTVPNSTDQGPKRLVIPVSAASFEAFTKYFKRREWIGHYGHGYLVQEGKLTSYTHSFLDYRMPSVNTITPVTLLKTTEALRAKRFLKFMVKYKGPQAGWYNIAMLPWTIPGNYCATGAFINCTQWIFNMPIGDKLVNALAFPGSVDAYAVNHVSVDKLVNAEPRIQELNDYDHADPLVKRVWGVPAHEQYADVIGMRDLNLSGDLANPGWLMSSLLGRAPNDRVPFVFLVVADHTAPIPEDFVPFFENPL